MDCQACHSANPDSNRFCESCGKALTYKCTGCGFDCSVTSKFCGGCGCALRPPAPTLVAQPITSSPAKAASGWGELKQATVLFADIVSSTEQIAELDPEAAMERLQPAILTMCDSVERFGGTVIRTTGDGVMALFGVPKALEGHATLACEAALQMQDAFANGSDGLSIRVGLHSGRVASDPYAADGTRGGGAHGLTIHLASRVVAVPPPGQIALTAECHALIRRGALVKSLGFPPLKGIAQRTEIFQLTSLSPQSRQRQFEEGKLSPLRGRDREIAALQAAQAQAQQGAGNVVGVTGAPGTGKSRVCFEFARASRERGVPVFEVHAQLYGHATPLQPALELLRVFFFRIPPETEAAAARQIILQRLVAAGLKDEADAALVHEFLGLGSPDASQLNPRARRARLLAIVRELFEEISGWHAVLVIEDLHWLDEASEEFVSVLINAVAGTRLLLVLNYRNSYASPWLNLPHYQQLSLAELSTNDTAALVRELVSNRREFNDLYELIARRSGGNPFFAEELVQSLAESGALGEAGTAGHDAGSIDSALPSTVQAVIGARIDRLGEAEKSVLQTCAIVGKEIPLGVLVQVTSMPLDALRGVLDRLYHAQLIQPADGARHFAFRHPLIQEVAYSSQLKARRNAIHASVAGAMVGYYTDRIDEYAALVAYHFAAAGNNTRAAAYESKAAQWLGAVDPGQATKHWHRVRSLLEGESGSDEADRLKVMANSKICWLGWREGLAFDEVKPFIDEALVLANRIDPAWTQLLLMVEGRILQAGGASADLYVERVEKAISLHDREKNPGRAVTLNAALSQAYGWSGMLYEALAANDAALSKISHVEKFDLEFIGFSIEQWVLAMRGRLLTRLGRFDDAARCLDQLVRMSGASIDPVIVQMPHYGYVELAAHTGNVQLARDHLALASDIADRHPSPYLRVFSLYGRALLHAMQSEFDEAALVLGETLVLVRNSKVALEFETEILASLSECHRRARSLELALAISKEAVRLSSARGNRLPECRALITWAGIVTDDPRLGAPGEAASLRERADALIRTTGARSYENGLMAAPVADQVRVGSLAPAA